MSVAETLSVLERGKIAGIEAERRIAPRERMIHLEQLGLLNRLADARRALLSQLDALKAGKLVVTIDAERQDEAMLAHVGPEVERLLQLRLQQLTTDLQSMGLRTN